MSVKPQVFKHSGYEAALSRAAFYIYPAAGFFRISGEDRIDFLQRQTTNDLNSLRPGGIMQTVLTSPTARILDVFYVFMDEAGSLGVLTLPGYAVKTIEYLKKRIFFKDRVTITDDHNEYAQLEIVGPSACEVISSIELDCPSEKGRLSEGKLNDERLLLFGTTQTGYRMLVRVQSMTRLVEALVSSDLSQLSDEEYDVIRIENGIPAVGKEITEEYTPLELNMDESISTQKGCYTGQEVIARQLNYDKITRRLIGLRLDAFTPSSARVVVDGKRAGELTSSVESPRYGAIALAVLKRPYFSSGTEVEVAAEDKTVKGKVCQLPFETSPER